MGMRVCVAGCRSMFKQFAKLPVASYCSTLSLAVLLSLLLRSLSVSLPLILHISFVFQLIAQYLYLILIVFVSAWPVVQFNIYVSRHKTFHFAPCAQLNR